MIIGGIAALVAIIVVIAVFTSKAKNKDNHGPMPGK